MVTRVSYRARLSAVVLVLLAVFALGLGLASSAFAAPEGRFIPLNQRNDVCFDAQRNLLYITSGSQVLRYDLGSRSYLSPIDLDGNLMGMDLSPDGSTLAVADTTYSGSLWSSGEVNWVYLVDLDSGYWDEIDFDRAPGEGGTWMVAFDAHGRLLASAQASTYVTVDLHRYDPDTETTDSVARVYGNTALSASGDRKTIAYAAGGWSNAWGLYHDSTGAVTASALGEWHSYEVASNQDGTRFSVPLSINHVFEGVTFTQATLPFGTPAGAKYSPDSAKLYLPTGGTSLVNVYNAGSTNLIGSFDTGRAFGAYQPSWTVASSFVWPRLAVGSSDQFMAVTVGGGVEYFDTRSSVHGSVKSSKGGGPVPTAAVQVWRQHDSTWSVEDTLTVGPSGGWSYVTTDTAPMRFRAYDPSAGHGSAWYGGTSLETAASAVTTDGVVPSLDVTLPFVRGGTLGGLVIDSINGYGVGSEKVTAWSTDASPTTKYVTTTASDGNYHFTGLPPGNYFVRFDDPTFTWHRQFYAGADTTDTAKSVFVQGPGSYSAPAQIYRHVAALELTPADAAPGSQLVAEIGGTISLQTTCTDAGADDAPRTGMPMVLQSSPNDSTWTTESVSVTQNGSGVYKASVAAKAISTKYYRFVVPSSDHIDGTESESCLVRVYGPSRWNGDAQIAPGKSSLVSVGQATGVTCQLIRYDGSPATGRKVVLQATQWGAKWWTSSVPVTASANGYYTAVFAPLQGLQYRLVTAGSTAEPSVASGGVSVFINAPTDAWRDVGGGRIGSLNSSADWGTPSRLDGWSTNFLQPTESVKVYSSTDGVNYTPMSVPVTNAGLVLRFGAINAHYTANIPVVKELRYYCFVMQGTGGSEPTLAAPSYAAYINPTPMFTLSATKRLRAGQKVTVTGLVKSRLTPGARVVTVLVRRAGTSSWKAYSRIALYDKGAASAFTTKITLSRRGTYYVRAFIESGGYTDGGPWGPVPAWGGSQHPMTQKVVVR